MMIELDARRKGKMCLRITRRISDKFQVLIFISSIVASNYLVYESDASIAMENIDIELSRTGSPIHSNATGSPNQQVPSSNSVTSGDQAMSFAESRTATQSIHQIFGSKTNTQPANAVPVYRSAPKQVEALGELGPSTNGQLQKSPASQSLLDRNRKLLMKTGRQEEEHHDLNHAAAGHYKKQKKKKKSSQKRKVKKFVKKKKKKVKIVKPVYHHHHEQHKRPKYSMKYSKKKYHHHHHQPAPQFDYSNTPSMGKYYEYRIVPEKGSWKYGFKRGNDKHLIERNEYKHKSHFKSSFDWKDKMGKGKHLFDYNHVKSR